MDKIDSIIARIFKLNINDIDKSLTMDEIEIWDSLSYMDLINSIEKEFNFELEMDEIIEMKSLIDIYNIVNRNVSNENH